MISGFAYKGLKNVKTLLAYDNNLLFLKSIKIKNTMSNRNQIAITKPNNYYTIEEMELADGKIHRVVDLSKVSKDDLTQSVISNYESGSLGANARITDGVLIQETGSSRITILPPEHQKTGPLR